MHETTQYAETSISGCFFGFSTNLVTLIDLILFTLVLYFSPVVFDRSHDYPATTLNLTVILYFWGVQNQGKEPHLSKTSFLTFVQLGIPPSKIIGSRWNSKKKVFVNQSTRPAKGWGRILNGISILAVKTNNSGHGCENARSVLSWVRIGWQKV